MDLPAGLHGQPGWVAALTPLPAGGMIVAEPIWARIGQDQALGRRNARTGSRSPAHHGSDWVHEMCSP
jgi:hypothetical protein